ncbi:MAG: gliding motility protein GldN [Chitinophagaceae bacterium]
MKRVTGFLLMGLIGISLFSVDANAQKKKAPAKKVNTAKKKKKPAVVKAPTVDTATTAVIAASDTATFSTPTVLPSLRNNSAVEKNLIKDKTPLEYEYLREDDQLYKQVVWRMINTKEKMNLPFGYDAEEENGSQQFIYILLNAVKSGELTAFSGVNDRFTTPMKISEIAEKLVGKSYVLQVPDWVKDPSGATMKDSTITEDFNPTTVETFQVKEEIIFDKESSRLHFRILGIAPMVTRKDDMGNVKGEIPLFWIYYPDARPTLAKFEAYNPRNYANRMSWEEVFESHYFTSHIIKSTLNNPGNKMIAGMISDPLLRLVEGENVKEAIFNFEQSQWSY